MTAVGLIEPQQECAALRAGLRLRREVWLWAGSMAGPAPNAPLPRPAPPLACFTVSSTTAGEDTEKALQAAAGVGPGAGSASSGKLRL